ncbi:MAG: hypothetical protein ABGX36_05010 [Cycloclasticus sp.]
MLKPAHLAEEGTAIKHLLKAHTLDKKYLQPLFEVFDIHINNKNYKKASLILEQLKKANKTAPITRYKEIISIEMKLQISSKKDQGVILKLP